MYITINIYIEREWEREKAAKVTNLIIIIHFNWLFIHKNVLFLKTYIFFSIFLKRITTMFNIDQLLKWLKIAEESETTKSQISVSHWEWFCVGLLYLLHRWHWGQTSSWSLKVEVNLQGNECTCRRTAPYLTSCSHKSNETVQIPSHQCLRSRSRSARSLGRPCGCSGWTRKM